MLNYKSIHPHSIQRQNVKLALRIFHVNNAAALRTLGPYNETLSNWQGTALLIDYIISFGTYLMLRPQLGEFIRGYLIVIPFVA